MVRDNANAVGEFRPEPGRPARVVARPACCAICLPGVVGSATRRKRVARSGPPASRSRPSGSCWGWGEEAAPRRSTPSTPTGRQFLGYPPRCRRAPSPSQRTAASGCVPSPCRASHVLVGAPGADRAFWGSAGALAAILVRVGARGKAGGQEQAARVVPLGGNAAGGLGTDHQRGRSPGEVRRTRSSGRGAHLSPALRTMTGLAAALPEGGGRPEEAEAARAPGPTAQEGPGETHLSLPVGAECSRTGGALVGLARASPDQVGAPRGRQGHPGGSRLSRCASWRPRRAPWRGTWRRPAANPPPRGATSFSLAQGVSKTSLAPWKLPPAAGRCTRFYRVRRNCK
jgi:hypothetical protein